MTDENKINTLTEFIYDKVKEVLHLILLGLF